VPQRAKTTSIRDSVFTPTILQNSDALIDSEHSMLDLVAVDVGKQNRSYCGSPLNKRMGVLGGFATPQAIDSSRDNSRALGKDASV